MDSPHDPPCVRCRRESKECYFSATRRKRRKDGLDGDEPASDEYAAHNRRRKLFQGQTPSTAPYARTGRAHDLTQGIARSPSPSSPEQSHNWSGREGSQQGDLYTDSNIQARGATPGDQEVTNETAAALFQSPINGPADALHMLLEASGRTGDLQRQTSSGQGDPTPNASSSYGPGSRPKEYKGHQDPSMQIDLL